MMGLDLLQIRRTFAQKNYEITKQKKKDEKTTNLVKFSEEEKKTQTETWFGIFHKN